MEDTNENLTFINKLFNNIININPDIDNEEIKKIMKIENNIILESNDGKLFKVHKDIVNFSELIKSMTDEDDNVNDNDNIIPLPNINSFDLKLILLFFEINRNHELKDFPKPLNKETFSECINLHNENLNSIEKKNIRDIYSNYINFVKKKNNNDLNIFIDLMNSTNFLAYDQLLNFIGAFIGFEIRKETPDEIRKILRLNQQDNHQQDHNVIQHETKND